MLNRTVNMFSIELRLAGLSGYFLFNGVRMLVERQYQTIRHQHAAENR